MSIEICTHNELKLIKVEGGTERASLSGNNLINNNTKREINCPTPINPDTGSFFLSFDENTNNSLYIYDLTEELDIVKGPHWEDQQFYYIEVKND